MSDVLRYVSAQWTPETMKIKGAGNIGDHVKEEQWGALFREFQGETDRACAVLGGAFLDHELRQLLEGFLVNHRKIIKEIFEGPAAPLQSFASKTMMAYALGFVTSNELHDLDQIRGIRNDFAHKLHGLSFSSTKIADRCAALRVCNHVGDDLGHLGPRDRFVLSVVMIGHWIALRRIGIRNERRTIRKEVQTVT